MPYEFMKLKNILIILAVLAAGYFIFSNCIKIINNSQAVIGLNENFSIKIGQTVMFEEGKIKIKFIDVSDSRCPSGVQCIWAGQVRVALNVDYPENNSQKIDLILGAGASDENSKIIGGYTIKLLNVEPYPNGAEIEKSDYTASLKLLKSL